MRKLIMWNLVTLDGFFEGRTSWELDWHENVWGDELERLSLEQLRGADMLLFGRRTYEGMAAYWPTATGEVADLMNAIPKIVFSRTLTGASWSNTRLVEGSAGEEVAALKREPGRELFVFGSAELSSTMMQAGLFDEYRICVVPVVLGGGTPLFKPAPARATLKLLEARALASGGVILRYGPA